MACGAPVVASATGGIKEVVVDGETGYLVPFDAGPGHQLSCPRAAVRQRPGHEISRALCYEKKCRAFGEAGRRRVEQTFSWSAIADQTIALYDNLIREHSGKPRA